MNHHHHFTTNHQLNHQSILNQPTTVQITQQLTIQLVSSNFPASISFHHHLPSSSQLHIHHFPWCFPWCFPSRASPSFIRTRRFCAPCSSSTAVVQAPLAPLAALAAPTRTASSARPRLRSCQVRARHCCHLGRHGESVGIDGNEE